EARRVAADLVQRDESRVAVERRVLHALGHYRGRRLLEAGDELRGRVVLQQQQPGQRQRYPCRLYRFPILVGDRARPWLDICPVDRQRRKCSGELLELKDAVPGTVFKFALEA